MATAYEQVVSEIEKRIGEVVRKGEAVTPRDAYSEVFKADPDLYRRYRQAANHRDDI
jgi:hypothetical protein